MKVINIQAAKTHLSRLVEAVVGGEEIVLAKAGKPLVRLIAYESAGKPRSPGLFAGKGWESPDCWADDYKVLAEPAKAPPPPAEKS